MGKLFSLKKILAFLTAAVLAAAMAGCSEKVQDETSGERSPVVSDEVSDETTEPATKAKLNSTRKAYSELFSKRDLAQEAENVTTEIKFGDSIAVDGSGAEVSGSSVTINAEGVYRLSGKLADGQVIVNAPKAKVQLVLDGAEISCGSSPAIYCEKSDKLLITTAKDSVNILSSGCADNACVFSTDSLTLNGCGALKVTSENSDGIHSKDDIVITGGEITVDSSADGIKGKDYVAICGGDLTVNAGEDGIKSTNIEDTALGFVYIEGGTFRITSGNDGIQAETDIVTTGGEFTMTTGGGADKSTKVHTDDFGGGKPDGFNKGDRTPPEGFNFDEMTPPDGFDFDKMSPPDGFDPSQMPDGFDPSQMMPPDAESGSTPEKTDKADTDNENSDGSASAKGLKGISSVDISGGTFTIDAADDTLHSNGDVLISGGTLSLSSGDDGIHADSTVKISDSADVTIVKSYEGIEGAVIEIAGGKVDLTASDDGINGSDGSYQGGMGTMSSNVHVNITGGLLHVNAQGDGIDSNGDLTFSGGTVIVDGPTIGANGALDGNGKILVNGGTLVAVGSSQMAECPDEDSAQFSIAYGFDSTQKAGTSIALCDESGTELISLTTAKTFDHVVFSCPDIKKGQKYTVSVDGTAAETVTADSTVTKVGKQSSFGGFGGFGGGFDKGDFQPPTDESGQPSMPEGGRFPGGKGDKSRGDRQRS